MGTGIDTVQDTPVPSRGSAPHAFALYNDMGLYEQITAARQELELDETATRTEIRNKTKALLKRWHPDLCPADPIVCHQRTQRILEAQALLNAYCDGYRFSFAREEVEKYLSPEEWWLKRFYSDH
jgi:hypothetical protein